MDYDINYHVTCSLKHESGRDLILTHFDQSQTYTGLLEGTPNCKSNDWEIENDLEHATKLPYTTDHPYLIPPLRRDYFRTPGDMDVIRERTSQYPKEWNRDPEWLPLIRCIGCFQSSTTSNNPKMDISLLTVLWYQNDFAMPINGDILHAIKILDWDALATDFEY